VVLCIFPDEGFSDIHDTTGRDHLLNNSDTPQPAQSTASTVSATSSTCSGMFPLFIVTKHVLCIGGRGGSISVHHWSFGVKGGILSKTFVNI